MQTKCVRKSFNYVNSHLVLKIVNYSTSKREGLVVLIDTEEWIGLPAYLIQVYLPDGNGTLMSEQIEALFVRRCNIGEIYDKRTVHANKSFVFYGLLHSIKLGIKFKCLVFKVNDYETSQRFKM